MNRILVVEDEPDIRLTLRMMLEMAGYAVLEAPDGSAGIELANTRPDVILLDIRLPDVDGLEVLQLLKAHRTLSSIPVVFLSAHNSPATVEQALDMGADAYVSKPFDFERLKTILASAASSRAGRV